MSIYSKCYLNGPLIAVSGIKIESFSLIYERSLPPEGHFNISESEPLEAALGFYKRKNNPYNVCHIPWHSLIDLSFQNEILLQTCNVIITYNKAKLRAHVYSQRCQVKNVQRKAWIQHVPCLSLMYSIGRTAYTDCRLQHGDSIIQAVKVK